MKPPTHARTSSVSRLPRSSAPQKPANSLHQPVDGAPARRRSVAHRVQTGQTVVSPPVTRPVLQQRQNKTKLDANAERLIVSALHHQPCSNGPQDSTSGAAETPEAPVDDANDPEATIRAPCRILNRCASRPIPAGQLNALEKAQLVKNPSVPAQTQRAVAPALSKVASPSRQLPSGNSPRLRQTPSQKAVSRKSGHHETSTPSPITLSAKRFDSAGRPRKPRTTLDSHDVLGSPRGTASLLDSRATKAMHQELLSPPLLSKGRSAASEPADELASARSELAALQSALVSRSQTVDAQNREIEDLKVAAEATQQRMTGLTTLLAHKEHLEDEARQQKRREVAHGWTSLRDDTHREIALLRWIGADLDHWRILLEKSLSAES